MATNAITELGPVAAQPGRPLYIAVKEHVREAIDAGVFRPGEQMPSTKCLSERLSVSLVTAHRALQELVACGVLHRAQGRGTFVHERYLDHQRSATSCRIGLLIRHESSLADYYHSQIVEGIRQASQNLSADLVLLRGADDIRNECNGYLDINPLPEELGDFVSRLTRRQPLIVVGADSPLKGTSAIHVDHNDLARQGVDYLAGMGHQRIGYVGGGEWLSSDRDRWRGFQAACAANDLHVAEAQVIRSASWHLDEREQAGIIRMLGGPRRPTAIFAGGYYFALNIYTAAATIGLRIPEDLSVMGVDDPPSAAYLSPPLTTLRQPLVQLGQAAVTMLCDHVQSRESELQSRMLHAELMVRRSSSAPAS